MHSKGLGHSDPMSSSSGWRGTYQVVPIMTVADPVVFPAYCHERAKYSVEIILQVFNPCLFSGKKYTVSRSLVLLSSRKKLKLHQPCNTRGDNQCLQCAGLLTFTVYLKYHVSSVWFYWGRILTRNKKPLRSKSFLCVYIILLNPCV
jgi:hypothetical protein